MILPKLTHQHQMPHRMSRIAIFDGINTEHMEKLILPSVKVIFLVCEYFTHTLTEASPDPTFISNIGPILAKKRISDYIILDLKSPI